MGADDDLDPALFQQAHRLLARAHPENLQRRVLRGDHDYPRLGPSRLLQRGRAHQRQLVERQCPAAAAGHGQDQATQSPAAQGRDHGADLTFVGTPQKVTAPGTAQSIRTPLRRDEVVVGQAVAVAGNGDPARRVDGDDAAA